MKYYSDISLSGYVISNVFKTENSDHSVYMQYFIIIREFIRSVDVYIDVLDSPTYYIIIT